MKRSKLVLLGVSLSFFSLQVGAQTEKFTGTWGGLLKVGVELRVVFHVKDAGNGKLVSTTDSPDQSVYGIPCDTTYIKGDELFIEMSSLKATYSGKLINDTTISGTLTQGIQLPLTLIKTDFVFKRNRPQTPTSATGYKSEDVEYSNKEGSIKYGATITIPDGKGPFPALIFITGSGPQDRDETIMDHKPFAVLADHLSKNGFIVLRVDDRGIGKTTGDFISATSADFANDVNAGLDYLLQRADVNKKKIGLLGHSEGGMIAPMVASNRKEVNFLVLLAAPGVRIIDLMAEQNAAIARSSGVSEKAVKEIKPLFKKVVESIIQSPDSLSAHQQVTAYTEYWASTQPIEILKELDFHTQENRSTYITSMIHEFSSPWHRYFISFDPDRYLRRLNIKVLALNGDKDIQVISSQNLPGIEASLKKSKSKDFEIKELKGLNHLFQECKMCTLMEYGVLEQTIAPIVLDTITTWLNNKIK